MAMVVPAYRGLTHGPPILVFSSSLRPVGWSASCWSPKKAESPPKCDLDTELIVTAARGPNTAAVSANLVVDERQMNALFLDVVRVSKSYGLKFPREFTLLLKQLLYFDRYTRLLALNLNILQDQRVAIANREDMNKNSFRRTTRM